MKFIDKNQILEPTREKTVVIRNLFPDTAPAAARKPGDVVLFQDNPPDTRTQPEFIDPSRMFNTLAVEGGGDADVIDVRQILHGSGIQRPDVRPAPSRSVMPEPKADPNKPDLVIRKKPKQKYSKEEMKELGLD